MAGTAALTHLNSYAGGAERQTIIEHNRAVADLEVLRAALAAVNTLVNQLQTQALYRALGNPGFAISTNFDVKNANAISYLNGGTLKTLSANTSFDTGTALTIPTVKWGAYLLSVDATGTAVATGFNGVANAGYASEAAAIAALTAAAATNTVLGYVTILAAGITWTAGTDALTTGTGGTPATTTNYYNSVNPNSLYVGAALTTTTVDAAGDMTAAQVKDIAGTVIAT
jgi:hypothetical protein